MRRLGIVGIGALLVALLAALVLTAMAGQAAQRGHAGARGSAAAANLCDRACLTTMAGSRLTMFR